MAEPTTCCDRIIPTDAARAIGRFRSSGPLGYRAADPPAAPLRATRDEAREDWHLARCSRPATPPAPEETPDA